MFDEALKLINKITDNGFKAYIVGGFVRDYLLGLESNDIDVTTNATPKDLMNIFKDGVEPKIDYGSLTVIFHGIRFEITTFRKDIGYIDNRRPDRVEYIDSLYDDLIRRDFTVNSLCIDNNGEVVDLLSAKGDLDNKIIRCIGDPVTRFNEDALRILRAIRFATILNFEIDNNTINGIKECKGLLKNISYYRKKEELDKIFTSKNVSRGISLLLEYGLDKELEIDNLNKVKETNCLIGIWSLLNVSSKYPFTKSEKELIKNINIVLDKNNMDPETLYRYGLYVNSVAGEMKGIDITKITESYNNLIIKNRKELDIDSKTIIKTVNKKAGPYINDIFNDLENLVLYRRIKNNREDLVEYIKKKYGGANEE